MRECDQRLLHRSVCPPPSQPLLPPAATLAGRRARPFMPALVTSTELALSLQACWTDSRCVPS